MKQLVSVIAVAGALFLPAWPAGAEHRTLVDAAETPAFPGTPAPPMSSLDVGVELGAQRFRTGRVQSETGRACHFRLDADAMDWITRAGWPWLRRRTFTD